MYSQMLKTRHRPVIGSMSRSKCRKYLAASWHIELILHLQRRMPDLS